MAIFRVFRPLKILMRFYVLRCRSTKHKIFKRTCVSFLANDSAQKTLMHNAENNSFL